VSEVQFSDFPFAESVHQSIRAAGFETPTPIQAACLPPILDGRDVIGVAQTGTGKTAAFALPIIQRLTGRPEMGAVVLAPTRELAGQIADVFRQLGEPGGIRLATTVGGTPLDDDYKALASWPNVLVATPGRLIDHIENRKVSFAEVEVLAVDEADRMHDMGFIPQIRRILAEMPQKRQTLMFTATMPADVERIARKHMRDPQRIQVGVCAPAHRARQELYEMAEEAKGPLLLKLLHQTTGRVLVFVRTKRGVDRLARRIGGRGLRSSRIHGDLEQDQRDQAVAAFRDGTCRVLVATDIAARGWDISDIEHVINYDFPHHAEDYVHRIGRTARVEASGLATSFVTPKDRRFLSSVRRMIGDKLPEPVRLDSYDPGEEEPQGRRSRRRSRGGNFRRSRSRGRGRSSRKREAQPATAR